MKSPENVMVTLIVRPGDKALDMELPAFMPCAELSDKLLETLRVMNPAGYGSVMKLSLQHGGKGLGQEDTLASRGIWDGGKLDAVFQREV